MKTIRKTTSLLLTLAMLLTLIGAFSVSAFDEISTEEMFIPATPGALYSVTGATASVAVRNAVETYGVTVRPNTRIEVQLTDDNSATCVVVTNKTGTTVTKDVINVVSEEDGCLVVLLPDDDIAVPMAGSSVNLPNDDLPVIRATAVYEQIDIPWDTIYGYQPTGMFFFCYNVNGNDVITNVNIAYICTGWEYTYPGGVDLSGNYPYDHECRVTVTNPAFNRMYQSYNPYRTDRVLITDLQLAAGVGHFMSYEFNVNGTPHDFQKTLDVVEPY